MKPQWKRIWTSMQGLAFAGALALAQEKPAPFKDGEKIVFAGDSITHGGWYFYNLQLFYATRFPERRINIINAGVNGDTATGCLKRIDSDLLAAKPDQVYIMFGMNDVGRNYRKSATPTDRELAAQKACLDRYRESMATLLQRLKAGGTQPVIVTPSPHDQYSQGGSPATKTTTGNDGLAVCAQIGRELAAAEGCPVVELHEPVTALMKQDPESLLAGKDRVHPDKKGHMVLTYFILKSQGLDTPVGRVDIDFANKTLLAAENCSVDRLTTDNTSLCFTYRPQSLPYPVSDEYTQAAAIVPWGELNREILQVRNLPPGEYTLRIGGVDLGNFGAAEFATGIDIATRDTPHQVQARKLYAAVVNKYKAESPWRRFVWIEHSYIQRNRIDPADTAAVDTYFAETLAKPRNPRWLKSSFESYQKLRGHEAEARQAIADAQKEVYKLQICEPCLVEIVKCETVNGAPPPAPPEGIRLLGIDQFETSAAAADAWRAQNTFDDAGAIDAKKSTTHARVVKLADRNVLELNCNFADTDLPRGVWDHHIDLDLSLVTEFVFDVYAENLRGIGSIHLYIGTGDGWYGAKWFPPAEGQWCRIRIPKSEFKVDKPGGGWADIDTFRFSPWAAGCREDARLRIANFGVVESSPELLIAQLEFTGETTEKQKSAAKSSARFSGTFGSLLKEGGLPVPIVSTQDLTPDLLARTKVLILPHVSGMPADVEDMILKFMDNGGKVVACFSLPSRLAQRLGVRQTGFRPHKTDAEFSEIRSVPEESPRGFPTRIRQLSWAVTEADVLDNGRVVAWWHGKDGQRTAPAFVASPDGAWFSHVFLDGDANAKTDAVAALVSEACPDIRDRRWKQLIAHAGESVSGMDWERTVAQVEALPDQTPASRQTLASARQHYADAGAKMKVGDDAGARQALCDAERSLTEAFCRAQRPNPAPEFRGTWCHPPEGIDGWGWEKTAQRLAEAGIQHLFLNALNGASAAYPSSVMPYYKTGVPEHDHLGDAIAACSKRGIDVHVWITNYKLRLTPGPMLENLRTEKRIAVLRDGSEGKSLCPSNEANIKLQLDAMVEAALRPGVAGVHFDYIRYGSGKSCFCDTCRRNFQATIGEPVADWPQDVDAGGKWHSQWLQFRCDTISKLVERVHCEVHKQAPDCLISAAVFKNYPECKKGVGQDWVLWCRKGWLDFVCPMNYTASDTMFQVNTENELAFLNGTVPCYPGIGLLYGMGPCGAVRQIQISRRLNTGGFMVWSVFPQYIDAVYPYLGMGILTPTTH